MLQDKQHYQHEIIKKLNFSEYIEWRCFKDLHLQHEFFKTSNKEMDIDFIGYFENFQNDFQKLSNIINLNLELPLKHYKKTQHNDYRDYYNKSTASLVYKYFKEDFDFFGYSKQI